MVLQDILGTFNLLVNTCTLGYNLIIMPSERSEKRIKQSNRGATLAVANYLRAILGPVPARREDAKSAQRMKFMAEVAKDGLAQSR